jgi:ferric-dicitrate binding protein FerR (iron transport regulator)
MTNGNRALDQDKAIEDVLRKAPPRPMPSTGHVAIAHDAIRSEWQAVTGKRRVRRRLVALAAAASVIIAVATGVNVLRVPSALPVHVAIVDRTIGTIYLLQEQSQLRETGELTSLVAGQTLVTGRDSAATISWSGGGDLRIDEDSRVEFVSPDEIMLYAGRVYFDAHPSRLPAGMSQQHDVAFVIRTTEGTVTHTGTQYMTDIDGDRLTVSVRDGQVKIVGKFADAIASAGQRVVLSGSERPTYTNIGTHGQSWLWVERMAPAVDLHQRSAYEFIDWVSRETGLEVSYAGEAVSEIARTTQMIGTIESEPRIALQILLQTTDLEARIENGRIVISER